MDFGQCTYRNLSLVFSWTSSKFFSMCELCTLLYVCILHSAVCTLHSALYVTYFTLSYIKISMISRNRLHLRVLFIKLSHFSMTYENVHFSLCFTFACKFVTFLILGVRRNGNWFCVLSIQLS
jgi:hypothetical protein